MCEYCAASETWKEPLDDDDKDSPECEWMPDLDETEIADSLDPDEQLATFESCERQPTSIVYDKFAEDHLCEAHKRGEKQALDDGLAGFLHEFGFQESSEFLTINAEAPCDSVGDLLSESVNRCGRPATHVKIVIQQISLCGVHAKESNDTLSGS